MMTFRKATVDDAAQLALLLKSIGWFELFHTLSNDAAVAHVKAQLARCLADESHSAYVAESAGGELAGYVSAHWIPYLFMRGSEGYVSELFVREAARGQQIGRRLLEIVRDEAHGRGAMRLSLINLRNRESYERNFYRKVGWQERKEAANFIYPIA